MKIIRILAVCACCAALCAPLWPQVATDANQRYQTPEGRKAIAASLGSPGSLESPANPAEIGMRQARAGL